MFVSKIQINNYKSIKEPLEIRFFPDLPTVLIGKNGSGKTNILEALEAISLANGNRSGMLRELNFDYKVYIRLSESDIQNLLPGVQYDKENCEIIAYNSHDGLRIDRIQSDYVVPLLKQEIEDVRSLAEKLQDATEKYERQLVKISHGERGELPLRCYQITDFRNSTTNFDTLKWRVSHTVEQVKEKTESFLTHFSNEEDALVFIMKENLGYYYRNDLAFKLKYIKPDLAPFEQKFIAINETAIKREITKINKATRESCDQISRYIKELDERTARLVDAIDTRYTERAHEDEKYFNFLREIQKTVGRKCSFLKSENSDVLFQDSHNDRYYYRFDKSVFIIETYLKKVYQGDDRDELLDQISNNKNLTLNQLALKEFEEYLNKTLPTFEKEMYERITVEASKEGAVSIFLHEKTGDKVDLNLTSAGRRWYFTYYFMKNTLEKGDIFLIDEPAGMLHPTAQKEVLNELMELVKKGICVVYSTHSPYLIPKEWKCVNFVTMEPNGTALKSVQEKDDLYLQMKQIAGDDIFSFQDVLEAYQKCDQRKLAQNCFWTVRKKYDTYEEAAKELSISVDTIKSWNRSGDHFRCPCLSNVITISTHTNIEIIELLK